MPGTIQQAVTMPIGKVAEVLPGLSTGRRLAADPAGTHQVVLSRHLVPGLPYVFTDADTFRITPARTAKRYLVYPGDVLFMSRGTRNVASWIESVPVPSVAPVSFYILRPDPLLHPGYLTWFLNQPGAQRVIESIRTGAGTPIVPRADFARIRIPVPDREMQRSIADLGVVMVHERMTLDRLTDATRRLQDATSEQIARGLAARTEHHHGN